MVHASKIVCAVIRRRIDPVVAAQVGDYQSGFRKGRGTPEQMLAYHLISEHLRALEVEFYTAFVDFSKAFDTVDWKVLWHILRIAGVPSDLVDVVSGLYDQSSFRIRLEGGEMSESIAPTVGVRQGCILSPMLFIIFLEFVLRLSMDMSNEGAVKVHGLVNGILEVLAYADDLALSSTSRIGLQSRMDRLNKSCSAVGLTISDTKTEVMVQNTMEQGRVRLNGDILKQVEHFEYLGGVQSRDGESTHAIDHRISKAAKAFWQLRGLWRSSLSILKGKLYMTLIRSILLYGAGTWTTSHDNF